MKQLLYIFVFLPFWAMAQPQEATLLFNWDDPQVPGSSAYNNAYNEIWGVVANDREIAIIGSTLGTHFFDVTENGNFEELRSAYVEGGTSGTGIIHRDYHDYECYLYAVADEGSQSTLQIIDISRLPDTSIVVYDSQSLIKRAHNIFIDTATAKLYACSVNSSTGYFPLAIYSLADPLNPVLLGSYWSVGGVNIPIIHDIYVENDIAYMNGSNQGLFVADFSDMGNPQIIGTLSSYPDQGYNHSGWLSEDGQTYFLADETHTTAIKALDISDPSDIMVLDTFSAESPESLSIPHNIIVRGNYLYASYYYDGLQVFDISDPSDVQRVAYYDTYTLPNTGSYKGAWGIYPFLPSGKILISDMQSGLYVFDKIDQNITGEMPALGSSTNCETPVTTSIQEASALNSFRLYPNPVYNQFELEINAKQNMNLSLRLFDLTGRMVRDFGNLELYGGAQRIPLSVGNDIAPGMYLLRGDSADEVISVKLIKQ